MANPMMPIAIVGVGTIVPGAVNPLQFWRNIIHKKDLIREVPSTHWLLNDYYNPDPSTPDKTYCKRGAFIDPIDFDFREFGVPPNNLSATDATQLLGLVCAKQLLEDVSNEPYASMDLSRVSIVLGITGAQELGMYTGARLQVPILEKALSKYGIKKELAKKICQTFSDSYVPWQENTFPGLLGNIVAGRIANRFNLGGMNCVADAACASTLAGISIAINELILNKCDMVITGGADSLNDAFTFVCFSKTPALSPTGDCRPFAHDADGTLLGEGLAFFALKRLEDAERDKNKIYAVIRGIGSSSDGRSKSIYAPTSSGQAKAILNAYQDAGYSPETVDLIEAHGTGTKAGDVSEFEGLRMAFQEAGDKRSHACALGSIKSQIGHAKAAAGGVSLLKTVLGLHHKILPPTIKMTQPNPQLKTEDTPFYFNTETRPWINGKDHLRRAGVSSFGFGGSNFHLTVEEYEGQARPALLSSWPTELVLFSARTQTDLLKTLQTNLNEIAEDPLYLTYIARKSQTEVNKNDPLRLAILATNNEDLKQKLIRSIQNIKQPAFPSTQDIYYSQEQKVPGKIAFLFPGKGSVYLNMGKDVTMAIPAIQKMWDDYARAEKNGQHPLHTIVFPVPVFADVKRSEQKNKLSETQFAEPALKLVKTALFNLMYTMGITPDYLSGEDLNEISEKCHAEVIAFHDQESYESLYQRGVKIFIEIGPGSLLTQNVQNYLADRSIHAVALDHQGEHGMNQLWRALAHLFILGLNPDFNVIWCDYTEINAAKFKTKSSYAVKISGTSYGKPYPAIFESDVSDENDNENLNQPEQEQSVMDKKNEYNANSDASIQLFDRFQQQLLNAQNAYQKMMLESHLAFLKTTEATLNALFGAGPSLPEQQMVRVNQPVIKQQLFSTPPLQEREKQVEENTIQETVKQQIEPAVMNTLQAFQNLGSAAIEPQYTSAPSLSIVEPKAANVSDANQLKTILLDTIAEKTGYPVDMLSMDMSLEADLGIDSIKRVEILAGLQERIPNLPEADPSIIAKLQTLNEIVQFIAQVQSPSADAEKKKR